LTRTDANEHETWLTSRRVYPSVPVRFLQHFYNDAIETKGPAPGPRREPLGSRSIDTGLSQKRVASCMETRRARSRALHEVANVVDLVDHLRILLDDVGESLGVHEGDWKLLVQSVVVPVHLRECKNACTRVMPAA